MSGEEPPNDLSALRTLEPVEPPRELMDRVRRQAHAELEVSAHGTWWTALTMAWNRVGLPAALTVTVVGYLAWAVSATGALYP
jgi:hypothetical protein